MPSKLEKVLQMTMEPRQIHVGSIQQRQSFEVVLYEEKCE
jgi:hypothetical protein